MVYVLTFDSQKIIPRQIDAELFIMYLVLLDFPLQVVLFVKISTQFVATLQLS